jgi:hypothetical protein
MTDARARLIAAVRQRFAAYRALPQQDRDVLDDKRLIPVDEAEELFEQAMRGELIFPAEGTDMTTWVIPRGARMPRRSKKAA